MMRRPPGRPVPAAGFTLVEVLIALALLSLLMLVLVGAMRTTRGGHSPAAACNCSSTAPGKASRERTSGTGHSGTHWPLRSSR